jgi:hypothetical protein
MSSLSSVPSLAVTAAALSVSAVGLSTALYRAPAARNEPSKQAAAPKPIAADLPSARISKESLDSLRKAFAEYDLNGDRVSPLFLLRRICPSSDSFPA